MILLNTAEIALLELVLRENAPDPSFPDWAREAWSTVLAKAQRHNRGLARAMAALPTEAPK